MEEAEFQWKEIREGEACILEGCGASPFVVVPEQIEGILVTAIGEYCFSGKMMQRVFLPDSVKEIGKLAFYNCTALQELQMGAALTEFGSDAFMNCMQLKTICVRCGVTERNEAIIGPAHFGHKGGH